MVVKLPHPVQVPGVKLAERGLEEGEEGVPERVVPVHVLEQRVHRHGEAEVEEDEDEHEEAQVPEHAEHGED